MEKLMYSMRPAVTLNVEKRLNRSLAPAHQGQERIATAGNLARIDRQRANSDAVVISERHAMSGGATAAKITAESLRAQRRAEGRSEHPMNVLMARDASGLLGSRLLSDSDVQYWVCTTRLTPPERVRDLRSAGVRVSVVGDEEVDLKAAFEELRRAGIEQVFVEGGDLNAALVSHGLVDELAMYISPAPRSPHDMVDLARALAEGPWLEDLPPLELTVAQEIDNDLMLYYTLLRRQQGDIGALVAEDE
jgi:riboflavin biosynthesis pyrimidine reductase